MKKLLLGITLFLFSTVVNAAAGMVFSWDANPVSDQVIGYQCEIKKNNDAWIPCDADIIAPATSITQVFVGAIPGDVISARVKAYNAIGPSPFTSPVSGVVPADAVPGTPTGLTLTIIIQ